MAIRLDEINYEYHSEDFTIGEVVRTYHSYGRDDTIQCNQGQVKSKKGKLNLNVTHRGRIKGGRTIIAPCHRVQNQAYQFSSIGLVEKMVDDVWVESMPKSKS